MNAIRTMTRLIIPVLLLTLLVGNPAFSADFQRGADAAQKGDYAIALREWTPLAKQGDADTQTYLGNMSTRHRPNVYRMTTQCPPDAHRLHIGCRPMSTVAHPRILERKGFYLYSMTCEFRAGSGAACVGAASDGAAASLYRSTILRFTE